MERSKRTVIIALCIAIFMMAVGFAAFSTTITIDGTANVTSDWNVVFTNIAVISKTDGATSKSANASGTTATFDVGLISPGDNIVYEITVENQGTLDAIIENIEAFASVNPAIDFEISNIKIGDTLAKQKNTTFNVTISYDKDVTSQPSNVSNTLTVDITYVQNLGQTITPSEPVIDKLTTLSNAILRDNPAQSDSDLDFSINSRGCYRTVDGDETVEVCDDTKITKGLYYTSTNTIENKTVYYFRGNVTNNIVQFGKNANGNDLFWKIIRINEDGSIRLIYNGTSPTATGSNASIGANEFNSSSSSNRYVGYMYGEANADTYELTHANNNPSTIKTELDNWYVANLKTKYGTYIADSGFCNDRTLYRGTGKGDTSTTYKAYERLQVDYSPQFACPNPDNDLFTLKNSDMGNETLDNPIGLITADEAIYAGGNTTNNNHNYYLYTATDVWTITPADLAAGWASVYRVSSEGYVFRHSVSVPSITITDYIRPVINLRSDVVITSDTQKGTSTNYYVVKTN